MREAAVDLLLFPISTSHLDALCQWSHRPTAARIRAAMRSRWARFRWAGPSAPWSQDRWQTDSLVVSSPNTPVRFRGQPGPLLSAHTLAPDPRVGDPCRMDMDALVGASPQRIRTQRKPAKEHTAPSSCS